MATMKTDSPVNYVHEVPGHCDRVIWRGSYYHLENMRPAPETSDDPHGPPFTVDRFGSLAECVIAERNWLRKRLADLEAGTSSAVANDCTLGVGDGSGTLLVHGSHDAIKRVQSMIFELEQLRAGATEASQCFDPSGCPNGSICARSGGCRYKALGLAEKTSAEPSPKSIDIRAEIRELREFANALPAQSGMRLREIVQRIEDFAHPTDAPPFETAVGVVCVRCWKTPAEHDGGFCVGGIGDRFTPDVSGDA